MKVYVVFTESADLDPYEGKSFRFVDSIWSDKQEARTRIKELFDKWLEEYCHKSEGCEGCSSPCESGHDCFYDGVVSPNEDEIVVTVDLLTEESFYIEEHDFYGHGNQG